MDPWLHTGRQYPGENRRLNRMSDTVVPFEGIIADADRNTPRSNKRLDLEWKHNITSIEARLTRSS